MSKTAHRKRVTPRRIQSPQITERSTKIVPPVMVYSDTVKSSYVRVHKLHKHRQLTTY